MLQRRQSTFAVLAIAGGLLLGLLIVVGVIISGLWNTGHSWDVPTVMHHMDCSQAGICRYFPGQSHTMRRGGGGAFQVRTNSIGFRGAEPPRHERSPDAVVIQLYGDSMMHGAGVDDGDTIAAILQTELASRLGGREIHVMNFAMPMNYLASQFIIYEHWGRHYRPDIAVFQYNGHVPSPVDINHRMRQIRDSPLASYLMQFELGRRLINQFQSLFVTTFAERAALSALEPGVTQLRKDRAEWGLRIAVFSFVSEFAALEKIFPPEMEVARIESGLRGWDDYRNSFYFIPGDGHPNPAGTSSFAVRLADALIPLLAAAGK